MTAAAVITWFLFAVAVMALVARAAYDVGYTRGRADATVGQRMRGE